MVLLFYVLKTVWQTSHSFGETSQGGSQMRKDEIKGWWEHPGHIIDCVRVLQFAFGLRTPAVIDYLSSAKNPVPIYRNAMSRAKKLFHPVGRYGRWQLDSCWQERLALAGLEDQTLEVIDNRRWAFALGQLRENKFSIALQRKLIDFGTDPPVDLLRGWQSAAAKRKQEPDPASQYLWSKLQPRIASLSGRG